MANNLARRGKADEGERASQQSARGSMQEREAAADVPAPRKFFLLAEKGFGAAAVRRLDPLKLPPG
jgi:hypothetical protein